MAKTFFLVLTSALVIDGNVCRAGELVEVGEVEAKNFLGRGKARFATEEDGIEIPAELPAVTDSHGEPVDLSKLNKGELLALAKKRKVSIGSGATNEQIIEAIEAAAAAAGEKTEE